MQYIEMRPSAIHGEWVCICQCRWQVELRFKWIKQHLRIKAFYGTTDSAVRTQVWIAISVYVLVAIVKKNEHRTKPARHFASPQPHAVRQYPAN